MRVGFKTALIGYELFADFVISPPWYDGNKLFGGH